MSTTQMSNAVSAASTNSSDSSSNSKKSNMAVDSETFLTLLVAQLKYQDPLGPKNDTEFLSQLAQMSSLEEMQQLNAGMSSIQAYSLVGKVAYAEVLDSDTGMTNIYSGTIDSIVSDGGTFYAMIGEDAVSTEDIVQVFDPSLLDTDTSLAESSNLIGKTVTGSIVAEDGLAVQVTGAVTGVKYENGVVYAVVGGEQIAMGSITDISEQAENVYI